MDEQTAEKKRLPIWTIILIVVLVVAVAILATVLIMNNRQKTTVPTTDTTGQSYRSTLAVNDAENHDNVDPYNLVRPQSSLYTNEYSAVVSRDDRSFINLRYGPDKTKYGVIKKIDNGEQVTIESKPVNGWVFVNYYGKEGWAKAEFLYK